MSPAPSPTSQGRSGESLAVNGTARAAILASQMCYGSVALRAAATGGVSVRVASATSTDDAHL